MITKIAPNAKIAITIGLNISRENCERLRTGLGSGRIGPSDSEFWGRCGGLLPVRDSEIGRGKITASSGNLSIVCQNPSEPRRNNVPDGSRFWLEMVASSDAERGPISPDPVQAYHIRCMLHRRPNRQCFAASTVDSINLRYFATEIVDSYFRRWSNDTSLGW